MICSIKRRFSLLVLLALLLTNCRPTPILEPTATPTPRPPTPAALIKQINLNLAREPSTSDLTSTLDPALATDIAVVKVDELLFLGLTDFDERMEVIPELATEWIVSDDGLTWTFKMRRDVYWVCYDPQTEEVEKIRHITAHDVEYGVKRSLSVETTFNYGFVLYPIKNAKALRMAWSTDPESVGVRALDDYTVEFSLERPAGYFPAIAGLWMARPQPREAIERYGQEWTEPGKIWTNGPYVLTSWEHGNKIVLEKNPYYYEAEKVAIEKINWVMVGDMYEAMAMYEKGELDMTEVPAGEIERVRADPRLSEEFQLVPLVCTYFLGFNPAKPPFDSHLVRRAFSAAMDRRRLVREVLGGRHIPARTLTPPGVFGAVDPKVAEEEGIGIAYDPRQAREWLAQAGYPKGQGFPETTLVYASGLREEFIQAILQMWEEALSLEIASIGVEKFHETLHEGPPQVWIWSQCAEYPDANSLLNDVFHSQSPKNYGHWKSQKFDELVEEAAREVDPARRRELYKEAEGILCKKEAAIVPIFFISRAVLAKPWVERTFSPFGVDHVEKWKIRTAPTHP